MTIEKKQVLNLLQCQQFALETALDAFFLSDKNGNILYVNESACKTLGYSYDELTSMPITDIDPDVVHLPGSGVDIKGAVHRGDRGVFETRHRKKDGSEIPVEVSYRNAVFEGEEYSFAYARDITKRKEAQLRLEILQFTIDNAVDAIYMTDKEGRIFYANKRACEITGYSSEEITSITVYDLDPECTPEIYEAVWDGAHAGALETIERVHRKKDGTMYPVEISVNNTVYEGFPYSYSFARDITGRRESERQMLFNQFAIDNAGDAVFITDSSSRIVYANAAACTMHGYTKEELLAIRLQDISPDVSSTGLDEETFQSLLEAGTYTGISRHRRKDGSTFPTEVHANVLKYEDEYYSCSVVRDISEQVEAENALRELTDQLAYQAAYDDLTGLVNRREFDDRLQQIIRSPGRQPKDNVLCFLDLDRFKIINDTCGHVAGDELLRQLGQMLHEKVRKHDTLARLGGDEFAVLLTDCNLEQGRRVADTIRKAVQEYRFVWENKNFNIGVSIGVVPIRHEEETFSDVMKRADAACYQAKQSGRNRIHVYEPGDVEPESPSNDLQWMNSITSALEENRLQLCRQTITPVCADTPPGEFYEILLRMKDTSGRILLPEAFLPQAERYNLASRLDRWVILNTLGWFIRHPEEHANLWLCSMNLSSQSLTDDGILPEITEAFKNGDLNPEKFCFELSEATIVANMAQAARFIKAMTELGCHLALDDYGSGLASFTLLGNLEVGFLKIDGLLVEDILDNPLHGALVKSINDIGHVMGRKTIAKYVENERQLAKLRQTGVDYAQGFGIKKPELLIDGKDADYLHVKGA